MVREAGLIFGTSPGVPLAAGVMDGDGSQEICLFTGNVKHCKYRAYLRIYLLTLGFVDAT